MKTVTLANRTVPAIGIGTWHMGDDVTTKSTELKAIQTGLNAGATVIDTAEMYGNGRSETLVGQAIAPYDRDQLFLISKVLPNNASQAQMEAHLDASLKRLGTDYIDLYLYHWRGGIPLSETIDELQRLTTTGKLKSWGVSNFDLSDMQELWRLPTGMKAAANEDLYNLGSRGIEYSLLDWQTQHHVPLIAYSPVSNGDQLGANLTTNKAVLTVARQHNITSYQVLLAWAIHRPQILAIPQTSDPDHMAANVAASKIRLTNDDLALLDQAYPAPIRKEPLDIL